MTGDTPESRRGAVFVTGASGGIGEAVARRFLRAGWHVWGTARSAERLQGLSGESGFHVVELDLEHGAEVGRVFGEADDAAGGFDVVINNAGFGIYGRLTKTEWADWERQLAAMITHTAALVREQVRRMEVRGQGTLVNVSSLATEFPLPFMSGYNMAKAALSALSETLMQETRGTGVRVIDFRPGDVRTNFNRAMAGGARSRGAAGEDPDLAMAWRSLEQHIAEAPLPEQVAADLWRAVVRDRAGIVRSGGFFQARLAPFLLRLAPSSVVRAIRWRYFGLR